MKKISLAIDELRSTVRTISLVEAFLDSLVVFLICFLVLILVNKNGYYAFVPFGLYFIVHMATSMRSSRLEWIEKKVPSLREALRTAADNIDTENQVVNELHEEVLSKIRQVSNAEFIGFGRVTKRLLTMIVLSFIIIFASAASIQLFDFDKTVEQAKQLPFFRQYDVDTSAFDFIENDTGNIYGNKSVAELGYEQLDLKITPSESEIDINDIQKAKQQDFTGAAPEEIKATFESSYSENIPKGYHKIVRNYFKEISKS